MDSIFIKFRISTVQYEEPYLLGIEMDWSQELQDAISADTAFTAATIQEESTLIFEGTLNGDVVIQQDARESIYTPLITSKLKFNVVTHNFPSWLMEHTFYYTNIRVVLATEIKGQWHERWRGYLCGNTLNSTVVKDWIYTPIFALDELSMAKYMKISHTIGDYGKDRRLYNYFNYYKTLNDSNFGTIYTLMQLDTDNHIYVDEEMVCYDSTIGEINDLLGEMWFNDYLYVYQENDEEKKHWNDLFSDVCNYLGLVFSVGGYGEDAKDAYLLETQDIRAFGKSYIRRRYTDEGYSGSTTYSASNYTVIETHEKLNADFNFTLEPQKYKGATVKSEAKRYEAHEYLQNENLDYYNVNKSCIERWGTSGRSSETVAGYCIDSPMYHKLYYMKPNLREDNYITLKTANINLADSGDNVTRLINGNYIKADTSAQNYNYPYSADNLSFLAVKRGAAIVKLGEFDQRCPDEDSRLENYLIMMNHKWFQTYYPSGMPPIGLEQDAVQALGFNDYFEFAQFYPFKNHEIRHNNEEHYIKIDYDLIPLNENIGNLDTPMANSPYHTSAMTNTDILLFPSETTSYDYGDDDNQYATVVGTIFDGDPIFGIAPQIELAGEVGDYYLSQRNGFVPSSVTGQTRYTHVMHYPDSMETQVQAISADSGVLLYKFTAAYNTLHPKNDTGKQRFLLALNNGSPQSPMNGSMHIDFLGPAIVYDWREKTGGIRGYMNNVFFLIRNIQFSITDMAEIEGKDMEQTESDVFDTMSKTKEMHEVQLNLCSPKYEGQFCNCFTYDTEKQILNARNWCLQGNFYANMPAEYYYVNRLCNYDAPNPMELDMTIRYHNYDNYDHSQIIISGLTETQDLFLAREKTFNVTRNQLKIKANRVYLNPWADKGFSHSGTTYGQLIANSEEENEE